MIARRKVLLAAGATLALPILAHAAQPSDRPFRVGHLSGSGAAASKQFMAAFREGMRMLGWIEGKQWTLEERYADGNTTSLPDLAKAMTGAAPNVLLVSTTPANLTAKAATSSIPIVMVLVADPVGAGIVSNLARPGGNITGITNIAAELAGKRLEIIREIVPNAQRIAVMINHDSSNASLQMKSAEAAARRMHVSLQPVLEVRAAADLEPAFQAAVKSRASAVIRMIDPLVFILRKQSAELEAKYRLPMIYPSRDDVEAGGLVSYGADIPGQYRQAATFVSKILRGAAPASLPIEQPTTFELAINLKTAKALGIAIPQTVLVRATRVIE
jgi:putative ABC transport system substrate-binding protein